MTFSIGPKEVGRKTANNPNLFATGLATGAD